MLSRALWITAHNVNFARYSSTIYQCTWYHQVCVYTPHESPRGAMTSAGKNEWNAPRRPTRQVLKEFGGAAFSRFWWRWWCWPIPISVTDQALCYSPCRRQSIGCLRFTKSCGVGNKSNIIVKRSNSSTQRPTHPKKKYSGATFSPQHDTFSWVGIGFI